MDNDNDNDKQEPVLVWQRWPPAGWTLLLDPNDQLRYPSPAYGQVMGLS